MSAITPPVQTVLDLFTTSLSDVRFGDLDAQSLARAAAEVQAAADVVASAQASLDGARSTLHERQETLLLHVQRALAYARVYAEQDEALTARLDAVALPRAARRARPDTAAAAGAALVLTADPQPAPRPRGRPRKIPLAIATTELLSGLPDAGGLEAGAGARTALDELELASTGQ